MRKATAMFHTVFSRMTLCLTFSALLLAAVPGCSKRIDTSTQDKLYRSWTEVMNSLPESKQQEFDEGMTTIWFYAKDDAEANAKIHGKTGPEILAMVEEMKVSLPKLDTSSKEAYEESLVKIKEGLPPSKIKSYDKWVGELPPYKQGNPRVDAWNGMTFQMIVESPGFK